MERFGAWGDWLRAYHDATLGFVAPAEACWRHGDFAPHNLVFRDGMAVAVIDFTLAVSVIGAEQRRPYDSIAFVSSPT